jgi:hypothetical protein
MNGSEPIITSPYALSKPYMVKKQKEEGADL